MIIKNLQDNKFYNYLKNFCYEYEWQNNTLQLDEHLLDFIKKVNGKINYIYFSTLYDFENTICVSNGKYQDYNIKSDRIISLIIDEKNMFNNFDTFITIEDIIKNLELNFNKIVTLNDFSHMIENIDLYLKTVVIIPINLFCTFFHYETQSKINNIVNIPKKLINVITKKTDNYENKSYCCWSYCWSIYEKKNDEEVLDIMCKYALEIGFQYIWVDKYCIDQNDNNEKNKEIPKMRSYYMNAQGTIVWLHDIEDINDDMNKAEWMERLWTLQEWELSKYKWILTKNGKYIKFKENTEIKTLLPKTRVNNLNIETNYKLHNLLELGDNLKCKYEQDKILGIIGMLPYSDSIKLDNVNNISDILYEILIVSNINDDNIFLSCFLGVKDDINNDDIYEIKKIKYIIDNYYEKIMVKNYLDIELFNPVLTCNGFIADFASISQYNFINIEKIKDFNTLDSYFEKFVKKNNLLLNI